MWIFRKKLPFKEFPFTKVAMNKWILVAFADSFLECFFLPLSHKDCGLNIPLGTVRKRCNRSVIWHLGGKKGKKERRKKSHFFSWVFWFSDIIFKMIKTKILGDKIQIWNDRYVTRKEKQYPELLLTHWALKILSVCRHNSRQFSAFKVFEEHCLEIDHGNSFSP